jgi:hypothetical protein
MRMVSTDGEWRVDVVGIQATSDTVVQWYRVNYKGYFHGQYRTVEQMIEAGVPLADLHET